MKHNFKKTAIAMGLAQMALMLGAAQAQEQAQAPVQSTGNDATVNTAAAPAGSMTSVVVTGQRAALQSAQKIKQNADEVVDSIAACFIGGTSMRGGSGTVYGALIGALVMASLDNGMSMLDVDSYWQMIVKGAILTLAVWVDVATRSARR